MDVGDSGVASVAVGDSPTADEEFYLQWGRESLKNNLVLTNDVLRQLVTLNATLLGGSILLVNETAIAVAVHRAAAILFAIGLLVALLGVVPYEAKVDLQIPDAIREHKRGAFLSKRKYLWAAAAFTIAGFVVFVFGLFDP